MMQATVRRTIEDEAMIVPGDRVGVAVSGGADSVALLALLRELYPRDGGMFVVIHVNHGLRSQESERDAAFVANLARAASLPLLMSRADSGRMAAGRPGGSLEGRARMERYRLFEEAGRSYHLTKIALGHTLDDQAETVLMKFVRGAGPAGLRGMLPVRDGFYIRPLLAVTREQVLAYLDEKGASFVVDATNADERFLRNRIRRSVLPYLSEACNPRLNPTLARTAAIMREEEDFLGQAIDGHRQRLNISPGRFPVRIRTAHLLDMHRAVRRRLVKECIEAGMTVRVESLFEQVESVLSLAAAPTPSGRLDLGGGVRVRREYDDLVFERVSADAGRRDEGTSGSETSFSCPVRIPGKIFLPPISRTISLRMVSPEEVAFDDSRAAFMDADALEGALTIRSVAPGDRIQPLGMSGHKKLKSLFIDAKIPRLQRWRHPVLADGSSVVWVPGLCLSDRVRVRDSSLNIVKAELI